MLEAFIDANTGDVIVVKPLGSVWGRCEVNAVVLLDDPELEKELAGKQHIVHPYAVYENEPQTITDAKTGRTFTISQPNRIVESLVKIDVAAAKISKAISAKTGVLRVEPTIATAKIADVLAVPLPSKAGAVVQSPARKLPAKTIVGVL